MRTVGLGTFTVIDEMRALVNQVLDSGRISYGPMSQEFERRFAEMHGCKHAVLSNSGTSSLQVALQALKEIHGWEDGDEVIVPAVTFVATVNVVIHNRLKPVLVDVDPAHYDMDVGKLFRKLSTRTRAVIPVHLFGQPCDISGVIDLTSRYGINVIEDSCECALMRRKGLPVGSFGDVGCFSTYVAHLLSTGVGGIATTNDPDLAIKMRSLVNHGRDGIYLSIDDDVTDDPDKLREVVSRRFSFESVGHSYRITELEAALGLAQLDGLEASIVKRRANAAHLTAGLSGLGEDFMQLPSEREPGQHAYMMYPIVLKMGNKWNLCNYLEQWGVETREMMRLTDQPAYRGMFEASEYPVALNINENGFYIGCHQDLMTKDLDYVVELFRSYYGA